MQDHELLLEMATALDAGPNGLTESQCASFAAKLRDMAGRLHPKPADGPGPHVPPFGP